MKIIGSKHTVSLSMGYGMSCTNQEDLDFIKSLFTNKEEMNLENWK